MRLLVAMLEVVAEKGYEATSVADVVARAGASRKTFYAEFRNREECLMAAADLAVEAGITRVRQAYEETPEWPERAGAGILALFELAAANPGAVRVAMVEVAAAGRVGIERRERTIAQYESFIRDALQLDDGLGPVADLVLKAIMGGLRGVLYRRIQRGQHTKLPALVPDLVRWVSCYYPVPPAGIAAVPATLRPAHPASRRTSGRAPGTLAPASQLVSRRGLPRGDQNVSHSFVVHNQRERILDTVANLVAANGYSGVTVEDITKGAAISQTAFYEHFEDKEDAFLVTYEVGHVKCLGAVERAYLAEDTWQQGVRAGIAALLEFLASEPAFARLALIDTLTASRRSAKRSDAGMTSFARMLAPADDAGAEHVGASPVTVEAIAAGIFELCLDHALRDRIEDLPELTGFATYFALAPFIGDEEAARVAVSPAA